MLKKELDSSKIKILVCCHKPCDLPKDDILLPIQVGAVLSDIDLGIQRDDQVNGEVCDNISEKNKTYCELTALYWAWKNLYKIYPDVEYIGLCHYRRFFSKKRGLLNCIRQFLCKLKFIVKILFGVKQSIVGVDEKSVIKKSNHNLNSLIDIRNKIYGKSIIATYPVKLIGGSVNDFFNLIGKVYIDLLKDICRDLFPDYYPYLEKTLNGNKISAANMIIIQKRYFEEYCTFLFTVLEAHEKQCVEKNIVQEPQNEKIYSRVSGYLGELLTYTFVLKMSSTEDIKTHFLTKIFIQ